MKDDSGWEAHIRKFTATFEHPPTPTLSNPPVVTRPTRQARHRVGRALVVVVLGVFTAASIFWVVRVNAQDDITAQLRTRLTEQGVPVKAVTVVSRVPLRIEVTIQSSSTGQLMTPDDPGFQAAVRLEAVSASRRGSTIDSLLIRVVNTQGETLLQTEQPIDPARDTTSILPSRMSDQKLARRMAQLINNEIPLGNMSLDGMDVERDADGAQMISMTLSTQDVETANEVVPYLIPSLGGLVNQLTTEGATISGYRVDIFDAAGQPLLRYTRDYLGSQSDEHWWQAPGMTMDWFPQPAPIPDR